MRHIEKVPAQGYNLPLWKFTFAYRATALAYMQRENVRTVEHKDGRMFTFDEIKEAIL